MQEFSQAIAVVSTIVICFIGISTYFIIRFIRKSDEQNKQFHQCREENRERIAVLETIVKGLKEKPERRKS